MDHYTNPDRRRRDAVLRRYVDLALVQSDLCRA
jgi:hypothetical protein